MTPSPESSLQRFLNTFLGDPDGKPLRRVLYYVSRLALGGIVGFFIVASATPRKEGGQGFDLEIYLAAIVAGTAVALAIAIIPRHLRPKDWPTREEFRKGAPPPKKDEG